MPDAITPGELVVPITVDYLEEDDVYQVSCPLLQGCHAWGETLDEAMRAIPGNIRAMLEARRAKGQSIPSPFEHAGSKDLRPGTLRRILADLDLDMGDIQKRS